MTNEQIIMNTRVNLMRNNQLGTTGRKIIWIDKDGIENEIDEPAEIHTYTGWKRKGFQVPKGTKAQIFIPTWSRTEDGSWTQRNAGYFKPEQVVPIEDSTEFNNVNEEELPWN
jgi:hypothetical protein